MHRKTKLTQDDENLYRMIEPFRKAQSSYFMADTELESMGTIARKFSKNKVELLEKRISKRDHEMKASLRQLSQLGHRYLDMGDGTVFDCQSQLFGLKEGCCLGKKSWQEAIEATDELCSGFCGLNDDSRPGDWRLPDKGELPNLYDWQQSGLFDAVITYYHWSSSSSIVTPETARIINLHDGGVYNVKKVNQYYFWPVRGTL